MSWIGNPSASQVLGHKQAVTLHVLMNNATFINDSWEANTGAQDLQKHPTVTVDYRAPG